MSYDADDGRHFKNTFPDYKPGCGELADGQISPAAASKIQHAIEGLVKLMLKNMSQLDGGDESAYTGLSGVAYMFRFLAEREPDSARKQEHLTICSQLLSQALSHCRGRTVTVMCGDAGPLLTALLAGVGDSTDMVGRLLQLEQRALLDKTPDEILYGRAGFLYALLVCRGMGIKQAEVDACIKRVVAKMLESGRSLSAALKGKAPPLMYAWHDSYYLGAAHGLTGILYLLMHVPAPLIEENALANLVRPTIDFLMGLQFPSGNFPSSWGRERDTLVHWCHGAPGWIYMFARAYEVFQDERYLQQARVCGEVIWARGFLKKGYGICHGVAGNGYAFLLLYRLTGEEKYLYRAVKFAEFCCDYGRHGCRQADRPFSLFEGLAGTIYFMKDLLLPQKSRFPAYEL